MNLLLMDCSKVHIAIYSSWNIPFCVLKTGPPFLHFFLWRTLNSPKALNLDVCMSFPLGNLGPRQDLMGPLSYSLLPVLLYPLLLSLFVISITLVLNIVFGIWMPFSKYMSESTVLQRTLGLQR